MIYEIKLGTSYPCGIKQNNKSIRRITSMKKPFGSPMAINRFSFENTIHGKIPANTINLSEKKTLAVYDTTKKKSLVEYDDFDKKTYDTNRSSYYLPGRHLYLLRSFIDSLFFNPPNGKKTIMSEEKESLQQDDNVHESKTTHSPEDKALRKDDVFENLKKLRVFDSANSNSGQLLQTIKTLESATRLAEENQLEIFLSTCRNSFNKVFELKEKKEQTTFIVDELVLKVTQLSLELYRIMKKPESSGDLDLASALVRDLHQLDPTNMLILRGFAEWISRYETPVADLNWTASELLKLSPYLTTIHLIDYHQIENKLPLSRFLQACTSAKKLIFFGNICSPGLIHSLQTLPSLDSIEMRRCQVEGGALEFSSLLNLKNLSLKNMSSNPDRIDLSKNTKLKTLELSILPNFSGSILLPDTDTLEKIDLELMPQFNKELILHGCIGLKSLHLNLLRSYNQRLDLSGLKNLSSLEIEYCDKWNGELILPPSCPLEVINLTDARMFSGKINGLEKFSSLKKVILTNCRKLTSEIDFSKLPNLTHVIMKNCFDYTGSIDCSQAKQLEILDANNSNRIGEISYPSHLSL